MGRFKSFLYNIYLLYPYATGRVKRYHQFKEAKGSFHKLFDQIYWLFSERTINRNYYLQGIDSKDRKVSNYIGPHQVLRIQNEANKFLRKRLGYNSPMEYLTKDKFIFASFAKGSGIPVAETLFIQVFGKITSVARYKKIDELEDGIYFIKNTTLESGEGVKKFDIKDSRIHIDGKEVSEECFLNAFNKGVWIIQRGLFAHNMIRKINTSALNTTRIYTINTGSSIEYLGSFQAFATDDATIDSWQFGSVYVGINSLSNKLSRYGVTSLTDSRPGLLDKHPNSDITFEDYEIPFIQQSIDLCKHTHSLLYGFFIIGWDVAITEKGPIIIEANEKPGINVIQCFTGGLKPTLKQGLKQLKKLVNE